MPALSNSTFSQRAALAYVTGGTLLCVWTLVWYFTRDVELSHTQWFWAIGFFLTGGVLVFLGLTLGLLSRAEATVAETPSQPAVAGYPGAVTAPAGTVAAPVVNPVVLTQPAAPVPPVQVSPAR